MRWGDSPLVPFPKLDEAFDYVAGVAEEEGRDPDTITVAPYVPAVVADDGDEARAIAAAWRDGNHDGARALVTDEMLDALGIAGTPEAARQQLRDLVEEPVVTRPLVTPPSNASNERITSTIEALAPGGSTESVRPAVPQLVAARSPSSPAYRVTDSVAEPGNGVERSAMEPDRGRSVLRNVSDRAGAVTDVAT
ncbi:LLM class flavin-dependent oxidoreductase [Haloarculaceae archaeon H-GB1-1]|nr:LLM class flavin-dependent oxidoreductase [Haloarculaceae archaeon H-GB1-1]